MKRNILTALAIAALTLSPALSQTAAPISSADVLAAEHALADPAMRGRGSGTADEARAADWVAAQFKAAGLQSAPGMASYLQTAPIERRVASGAPTLTVDGTATAGVGVLTTDGGVVGGKAAVVSGVGDGIPQADVLVYTGPADGLSQVRRAARGKVKLIVTAESDTTRRYLSMTGGKPQLRTTLAGGGAWSGVALATLPVDALATIKPGDTVSLDVPFTAETGVTTNAIAYLPGTDPKAGVILLSAHLDHLGVRDGKVFPGANDDASGTVAVIELARTFAAMGPAKRGILFVAYGSEELGGLGSTWFGQHPPIALDRIVANIELEMIGAQDAKLPKGALMMTGAERSDLFQMLKANGALVAPDPYPEQHFFERSDNYSLALKGIVAHTLSGWVGPTYHQPTDTVENLDIDYMTAAINSLVAPIRKLADGGFTPQWTPNGRPQGSR